MSRLNLSDAVDDLAPAMPPCFFNRMEWIEYLKACAAAQNQRGEPKIILVVDGEPAINYEFPICADCTQKKSLQMDSQGRCDKDFLKKLGQK